MIKKALITGISGFVGPYLKSELINSGYEVYGFDKNVGSNLDNVFSVDITDFDSVKKNINFLKPDLIFHLAGISSPVIAEQEPVLTKEINVIGTKNILEAILECNQLAKVLVVSSSYVYGKPEYLPIDEKHCLNGSGVYAESRILQEKIVADYFNRLPVVIARSFNHTGSGQNENFIIPKIIKSIIEIKLGIRNDLSVGDLKIKRDISDVRDVVMWYRLLLEQEKYGVITNVCRNESISLLEIVEKTKSLACLDVVNVKFDSNLLRQNDPLEIVGSNKFLSTLIKDFSPRFTYEMMIKNIYEFWHNKLI